MKILLLLVLVVVLFEDVDGIRYTPYGRKWRVECDENRRFTYIRSVFYKKFNDRKWGFLCRNAPTDDCKWSGFVNEYEGKLFFQCRNKGAIVAMKSRFDSGKKDRRYNFRCCNLEGVKHIKCRWRCPESEYLAFIRLSTSHEWHFNGMRSVFSKDKKDRKWLFRECLTKPC